MSSTLRIVLAGLLLISTVYIFVVGTRGFRERQSITNEVNELRDQLYRARITSDRCRSSLTTSESSLQTLSTRIDSLRARVDSFEALGNGQVPAVNYDEYLLIFNSYNDSVSVWETRSERLLNAEASCRDSIEEHNTLSDSIQTILLNAGIETS
ncbi:MAG: hypothetical protein MK239_07815 [Gemmatimonadetes bacterium]|nr:hypothetical protein [Gemmatimonadota bacterium]